MKDEAKGRERTHAERQKALRAGFREAKNGQTEDKVRRQFFDVKKAEAQEDMMEKDYLHQLTDVYVEASGGVEGRGLPDNIIHALRRATTLFARLGYDSQKAQKAANRLTRWIMALTVVIVVLNLFEGRAAKALSVTPLLAAAVWELRERILLRKSTKAEEQSNTTAAP